MSRRKALSHEFVEYIPETLADGTIYVSVRFATAVHLCCCGCGSEVVTPISPADWQVTFDGVSVSLDPSIGIWSLPCQSHYWIRRNRVVWARRRRRNEIEAGRLQDRLTQEQYLGGGVADVSIGRGARTEKSLWRKIKRWLF